MAGDDERLRSEPQLFQGHHVAKEQSNPGQIGSNSFETGAGLQIQAIECERPLLKSQIPIHPHIFQYL